MRPWLPATLGAVAMASVGCGDAGPACKTGAALSVYPASGAIADSAATAPGNQVQYQAGVHVALLQQGSGFCAIPQIGQGVHPRWTSADTEHVTISSADDSTNGLAMCTGPTSGAVTLTATVPTGTNVLGANSTAPLTAATQITCR